MYVRADSADCGQIQVSGGLISRQIGLITEGFNLINGLAVHVIDVAALVAQVVLDERPDPGIA